MNFIGNWSVMETKPLGYFDIGFFFNIFCNKQVIEVEISRDVELIHAAPGHYITFKKFRLEPLHCHRSTIVETLFGPDMFFIESPTPPKEYICCFDTGILVISVKNGCRWFTGCIFYTYNSMWYRSYLKWY